MSSRAERQVEQLREGLVRNLALDFFDEEEIGQILRQIESFGPALRQKILALSLALSQKSSSLVANVLKRIETVSATLPPRETERWILHAFALLDDYGIDPFMAFVSKVDAGSLLEFQTPEGLYLKEIAPVLETFLRGISGLDLRVAPEGEPFTDTETVYLPPVIDRFDERGKNLLLYKLMAAHKWAQIQGETLLPDEGLLRGFLGEGAGEHPDIDTFFSLFPERALALDLYNIIDSFRLDKFLFRELPGLMRAGGEIRRVLLEERPSPYSLSPKTAAVECLYQYYLGGEQKREVQNFPRGLIDRISSLSPLEGPDASLDIVFSLAEELARMEGPYSPLSPPFFLGAMRPEKVSRRLREQRRARMKMLEEVLDRLINLPEFEPGIKPSSEAVHPGRAVDPLREYLLIKGRLIELDNEMQDFLKDKGGLPGGVLVKGSDAGGAKPLTLADLIEEEEVSGEEPGGRKYDEWDYRRGGYRRQWCSLFEHDIHPGHEPFVELTLRRYGGYVGTLKKKFELLKREPKTLKRQWEGEDIDIDAAVEAFSDVRAGLSPGENLFTRLDRQERNIAVLFLLDMSGSTKGWVNEAEKESLVLMCEALEALGDRYAIYGFSGMTRLKCDFYRVKGFEDRYAETVKRRIAGITPKDYTRMGPPIRHSVHLLEKVDAKTRLLITLSDGKPEDWDAYKGDYGIEDTRKALIEARERGIHSFCITIDREAREYLPHMFGEAAYVFIDDVRKLPNKITEIYRRLTT